MQSQTKTIELTPQFAPLLDPSRPAVEQITTSLKAAIMDMSLVPGQMISETEIGHLFGASRTPVRQAFTWLKSQGLIVTYPSRGSYVSKLSISEIKGAQFVREALEVSVVEALCEQGLSSAAVQELEENIAQQKEFIKSGNGSAFHLLDDNFHFALADGVGHPHVSHVLQREKSGLDRLRVLALGSPEHLSILMEDHANMFQAIQSRNLAKARSSTRTHVRRVLATLSDLYNDHRDYFDPE